MPNNVTNITVAGLGGQGVLRATDILAEVALRAGFDIKKSEIKGMSQRGGSVTCDVRYGDHVFSPMVPAGEVDYLLVLESTQVEPNRRLLRPGGVLLTPDTIDTAKLPNKKSLNVAMLGALSAHLPLPESHWLETLQSSFPEQFAEPNRQAFLLGRTSPSQPR